MNIVPTHLIKKKKVTQIIDNVPIAQILPAAQAEILYAKLIAKKYEATISEIEDEKDEN